MGSQAGYQASSQEIITFLFTDIEHSTRLAQQLREKYPEILERHRTEVRRVLGKYGGREIDAAGDGFFITFEDPRNAVFAAAEMQKIFRSKDWATEIDLKVRIGIHTGTALSTSSGFTGVEVHCASRICDAAHGGQVLVSHATCRLIESDFDEKLRLSEIGNYVFKDFSYPVELFQLDIIGMEQQFPQPRIASVDKRVAVLPFQHKDEHADLQHLSDGITEELILALGKVQGIRVLSRNSAFALKGEEISVTQIGQKLNVRSALLGRISRTDGNLAIAVELVDTDSGLNIWTDQYICERGDLVEIQDKIVRHTAKALHGDGAPEQPDAVSHRQTENAEAYDYYLRGRRFYLQFSNRGMELALKMFENAISADESYALAYAGIADCYSYYYQHKAPDQTYLDKARSASHNAIELAPTLAEAFVSHGIVLGLSHRFEEAEEAFKKAIECDPSIFLGWFHYARLCFAAGRLDKAARLFEQANRSEPEDYQSILLAAQVYDDLNCTSLAEALRQRGVEIAQHWIDLNPGDTRALYFSANALVLLGDKERSLRLLRQALALEPDDSMLLYNAGCIYALLEMKPEALTCLEESYHAGLTLRGWYENDSNLDILRSEPRFIALLEKMAPV